MIDDSSKGSPKNQVPTKQKEKTLALFLVALYNFSYPDLVTRSLDLLSTRLVLAGTYRIKSCTVLKAF